MVFSKLFKSLGGEPPRPKTLPQVGEATLGRALRLDASMLEAMEAALGESVSPDLVITGQGLVEMADETGTSWLHRFYDDEDRMLQAITGSRDGGDAEEWSFYVPAGSEHLPQDGRVGDWIDRLSRPEIEHDGERFDRLWYEGDDRTQPPVRFVETVYERADMTEGREIVQECMVYGREAPQGELLLLALVMGQGREATFERMLGTGLRPHQVTI